MESMMGHVTMCLSKVIGSSRGGNQPWFTSQWESRTMTTSPRILDAPSIRARIKPRRSFDLIKRTFRRLLTCDSKREPRWSENRKTCKIKDRFLFLNASEWLNWSLILGQVFLILLPVTGSPCIKCSWSILRRWFLRKWIFLCYRQDLTRKIWFGLNAY